jgi:hypothetical protein
MQRLWNGGAAGKASGAGKSIWKQRPERSLGLGMGIAIFRNMTIRTGQGKSA